MSYAVRQRLHVGSHPHTVCVIGASGGSRTHDLYFTKVLLYQLSYAGTSAQADVLHKQLFAIYFALTLRFLFRQKLSFLPVPNTEENHRFFSERRNYEKMETSASADCRNLLADFDLERVTGIEPVSRPWEGHVLPVNYTRTSRTSFLRKITSVSTETRLSANARNCSIENSVQS